MYLIRQAKKKYFSLDQEKIREFFPLEPVMTELFAIYSELLGVRIKKLDNVSKWHESVSVYEVSESSGEQSVIGYFYLDLFSRPGKYAHQCVYPMIPSFQFGGEPFSLSDTNVPRRSSKAYMRDSRKFNFSYR